MRAAALALLALAWTAAAQAQPAPPTEPDEAAEPAAPAAPAERINPDRPTDIYDSRVRQSFSAAESFQGRLDGGWIASWQSHDLLRLQLVDKGKGQVEGAWRDLRGPGLTASGLLDPTPVTEGAVDAVFGPEARGARAYRLTVRPTADGRLAGQLRVYDETFDVTLRRAP